MIGLIMTMSTVGVSKAGLLSDLINGKANLDKANQDLAQATEAHTQACQNLRDVVVQSVSSIPVAQFNERVFTYNLDCANYTGTLPQLNSTG